MRKQRPPSASGTVAAQNSLNSLPSFVAGYPDGSPRLPARTAGDVLVEEFWELGSSGSTDSGTIPGFSRWGDRAGGGALHVVEAQDAAQALLVSGGDGAGKLAGAGA